MINDRQTELAEKLGVQYWHRPAIYTPDGELPPVAYDSDRSPYARNYWTTHLRRLQHGYFCKQTQKFINPFYYGHMNFLKFDIENDLEQTSGLQNPLYRDNDHMIFDELYYNLSGYRTDRNGRPVFKSSHNFVTAKGRRMAWTTNLQGFKMIYFVTDQHRSIANIYAIDDKLITENLEMRRLYHELHPQLKFHKKTRKPMFLIKETQEKLVQGYYHNRKKIPVNTMNFFVTSKNPGAARGDKYGIVEIVEAGMHKNLEAIMFAMKDTVGQGKNQFGFIAIGGTSDKITNETEDYANIFKKPSSYNCKRLFLPASRVRLGYFDNKTGISDEKTARNDLMQQRVELATNPNPNVLLSFTQENPLNWEECFIPPSRNEYDRVKLDLQLAYIFSNIKQKSDYLRGYLKEELDTYGRWTGRYTFQRDMSGPWKVHKDGLPQPGEQENAYVIAIDDFYKNLTIDPTSKGAILVYRLPTLQEHPFPTDLPVAIYEMRPKRDMFHDECVLAMKVWPGKVNYEYNDDVFFERLEKELMMNRIIYWDGTRPGMTVKSNEISLMTSAVTNYLREDHQKKIIFHEVINGIKKWQSLNTDIGSAFHLAIAARTRLIKSLGAADAFAPPQPHQHVTISGVSPDYQGFGLVSADESWSGWTPGPS